MPRERNPYKPDYHALRAAPAELLDVNAGQAEAWVKLLQQQARWQQAAAAAMRKELKRRRREAKNRQGRGA